MAVFLATHDPQRNRSTTPSASRGGQHRSRTHAAPSGSRSALTPNMLSGHRAAPSSPSSNDRGAAGIAARQRLQVACSGRSWSRCSRSTPRRPRAPRPNPHPQINHCGVRARRAVEGTHTAQHARCGQERAQPARLVVPVCMRHELAPQPRAQERPHLPGEAGARGAHERAPARRAAPPREARERGQVWAQCWRQCLRERGGQAVE